MPPKIPKNAENRSPASATPATNCGESPNGKSVRKPPGRMKIAESRGGKKWLTEDEADNLRKAACKLGRHGHRDGTLILMGYTHGLRVSELVNIRWEQIDLKHRTVYIQRLKGSESGTHPLRQVEVAALKKLTGERRGLVFRSERGGPLSRSGVLKMMARAGRGAGITVPVNPHMLRHGCGYRLTNAGHDLRAIQAWLGHRNIQHTVAYTSLAPNRFDKLKFWED